MLTKKTELKNPKNILIFRLSSIGDIILTTALIRCIRKTFPVSQITFVVKKEFHDLIKYNTNLNKIIAYDKSTGFKGLQILRQNIKRNRYDWFIDIHNNIRSNYVKRNSRIPLKTVYKKYIIKRWILINTGINLYKQNKPVLLRYFDALKILDVKYDGEGTEVFFSDGHMQKVRDTLESNGYKNSRIAVLCPGASYKNKQWTMEGFAEIAGILKERGFYVVLLGGKTDIKNCRNVNEINNNNLLNIAGELKLLESAALLSISDIVVTNDSGMLHMAQSQKKPVVAIFGPTTKELGYFPIPQKSRIAEVELSCRPCTPKGLNHCPKKHFKCMKNISSKMVIKLIDELLNE